MFLRFTDLYIHPSILSTSRTTFFNKLSDIWYWLSNPVYCQIFKQEKWICLWPLSLGKLRNFSMGNLFFSYCDIRTGDRISQKAELFLNAMAWKRISLRGAKFSHDCLFVHQCSLAELPISNFTMQCCATVLLCHDHWGVLLSLWAVMNISIWMLTKCLKKSKAKMYLIFFPRDGVEYCTSFK